MLSMLHDKKVFENRIQYSGKPGFNFFQPRLKSLPGVPDMKILMLCDKLFFENHAEFSLMCA